LADTPRHKINVAFFLYSMTGGGAERVVSILAEKLITQFNIHLVLFNGPIDYFLPEGVNLHLLRRESKWRLLRLLTIPLVLWRYQQFCKDNQIHLSVSFDNLANYTNAGLSFFSGWEGSLILSERNPPFLRYGSGWSKRLLHGLLIRYLYPRADLLIACSKGVELDLRKHVPQLPKLLTIYNPLPLEKMPVSAPPISQKASNTFVFIHVGSFRSQKNHDLLLRAFAASALPDTELWLIGKGPLEAGIRQLAIDLGVGGSVRFPGFQADPYAWMQQADCLVLSSHYEGFPNVLLEALAASLPIIAVDCLAGPREILAPATDFRTQLKQGMELAEHGILTPEGGLEALAKAMQTMIARKDLQNSYREKARRRAADFHSEKIAAAYAACFQGALSEPLISPG